MNKLLVGSGISIPTRNMAAVLAAISMTADMTTRCKFVRNIKVKPLVAGMTRGQFPSRQTFRAYERALKKQQKREARQ